MIRISHENEILNSFRDLDRSEVALPETMQYPLLLKDYLTWSEPSGYRVYLVFNDPVKNIPMGVVFQRGASTGMSPPMMCEFCHSIRAGDGVMMLTAAASSKRRIGLSLCRDLSCKAKIEASAPGANDFYETSTPREKIQRLVKRMAAFSRQNLF